MINVGHVDFGVCARSFTKCGVRTGEAIGRRDLEWEVGAFWAFCLFLGYMYVAKLRRHTGCEACQSVLSKRLPAREYMAEVASIDEQSF